MTDADDADECVRGQLLVALWEGSAADTPARHQADKLASHLASVALEMAEAAPELNRSKPLHFRVSRGRWDRNRTCNLRFWRPNPACRAVSHAIATCRSA